MTFERIRSKDHPDFARLFQIYEESFPIHEQRTPEKQVKLLDESRYRCEGIYEEEKLVGLLLCWEEPDFVYVEHFAIDSNFRGQGLGERALALLKEQGKPIVLEIDPPVDGISVRRQGFYQCAGFWENTFHHIHPPYQMQFTGHPLVVMTWPRPWDRDLYEKFWVCLRDTVMADCKSLDSGGKT